MSIDQERVLRRFADAARIAHPALTALDQLAGDGDFGDNLREGLDWTCAALDAAPGEPAIAVAATVFLDRVGGTSGPLLGLLFQELGRALANTGGGDAPDEERARWARGVHEGLAAIQRVGEAEPGDRTMVDALTPARDALAAGAGFADTARAALAGAAATAQIPARRGRASYIGDRVIGSPDPGATGVALLFWALAAVAEPDSPLGSVTELVPVPAA